MASFVVVQATVVEFLLIAVVEMLIVEIVVDSIFAVGYIVDV